MEKKDERQIQQLEKILKKIHERRKQGGEAIIVDKEEISEFIKKELALIRYFVVNGVYVFVGKDTLKSKSKLIVLYKQKQIVYLWNLRIYYSFLINNYWKTIKKYWQIIKYIIYLLTVKGGRIWEVLL